MDALKSFQFRYSKYRRKLVLRIAKIFKRYIDEKELFVDFQKLGLKQGNKIIVHSAMSSIGPLKEGPCTFVNALKEYIGPEGLIIMPTHSMVKMYEYLTNYKNHDYNVRLTPSTTGAITEYFRQQPYTYRSLHPTHSIAAWGKKAKEFVSGHEFSKKPFDDKSPYLRIIQENFKVLAIGLDLNSTTLIRAADDLVEDFPFDPYDKKLFRVKCIDGDGKEYSVETYSHKNNLSTIRNNMRLFPYLNPLITLGKIGQADIMLFNAEEIFELQKDLALKGITTYKIG